MQTYIFCENDIDEYEKLILSLAISYAHSPMFLLKEEDIAGLSDFLRIDFQLLKKALSVSERDTRDVVTVKFGEDKIEYSGLADNIFFTVLVRIYFIYESFSKLNREVDYDAIKYNVGIFLSIVHEFDMIHSAIATYECMYHGAFSFDYTVFNDGNFRPMDFIRMLQLYMTCEDSMFFNNSIVALNYILLRYEFYTRINTLYLIAITQIYKHSSFLNSNVRKIANELYEHLLFILKNGRIISIQTNILHVMKKEKIINRGREANTTRMQIIYGYGNFDTYVLRLDLGHKGEELIHWNNKSPGGIKCCLFSKEEHQVIVKIHPEMESCFTNYDDRWALKERINCKLSSELKKIYENIRKKKEHEPIFSNKDEDSVITFIDMITKLLPLKCYTAIDTEEIYAKYSFNLDKIMSWVYMLYLTLLQIEVDEELVQRILEIIVDKAVNYEIIKEDEKSDFLNMDGVCLIVELAQDRVGFEKN